VTDFRIIPSIEQLRQRAPIRSLETEYGRDAVVEAVREVAEQIRRDIAATRGSAPPATGPGAWLESAEAVMATFEQHVEARLRRRFRSSLRPVINATGVIVHTNLGRAPLAETVFARVAEVSRGYATLEYDLGSGERGARDVHAAPLLSRLTGAESAVVVNNNAGAILLLLAALAAGREVIISRGELVEIGGGFRVPDVMAQSGARLREVGTTNRTRVSDYAEAITDRTALILRVHRSNFRIEGFTEQPSLVELVALGQARGIPVAEDLGSGLLAAGSSPGQGWNPEAVPHLAPVLRQEPTVQASIAAGLDLVCFSGDKLLGGPQAGIIVGRADLVGVILQHPLMRALRVDKMVYAALEATLMEYVKGRAFETIPVLRMLSAPPEAIDARARHLAAALASCGNLRVEILDGSSVVGGGSAPGIPLATRLLAVTSGREDASRLGARLRAQDPPVIARVENDRLLLDLRTVPPEEDGRLARALAALNDPA
jgi:L-seryl-tRNA(Ser) seleniumtransferase